MAKKTSTDHLIDPGFESRTYRGKLRTLVGGIALCREAKRGRPGLAYFNLPDGTTDDRGRKRYRRVYLGRWEGDPRAIPASTVAEAREVARRVMENGGVLPDDGEGDAPLTVADLWDRFEEEAKRTGRYTTARYARKSELRNIGDSYRWLVALYGPEPIADLTREKLKVLRDILGRGYRDRSGRLLPSPLNGEPFEGYSLNHARAIMRRVKSVLRWGWDEELVPTAVIEAARRVPTLTLGEAKCGNDPVEPVPEEDIVAVLNGTKEIKGRGGKVLRTAPLLNRQQRAIIYLCWVNAMRIGEACAIRPRDIAEVDGLLVYHPHHHKTKHRGGQREIALLGDSPDVLAPFMERDPDEFCFKPREAYIEARAAARAARKTPLPRGTINSIKIATGRTFPEHYSPNGVGQAVRKACEHLDIPAWSPGQLRHNGATMLSRLADEETARVALSHSSTATTRVYAKRDRAKVRRIAPAVGEEMRRLVPDAAALVAS